MPPHMDTSLPPFRRIFMYGLRTLTRIHLDDMKRTHGGATGSCSICAAEYWSATNEPVLLHAPEMPHVFCRDCASRWFEEKSTCPMCRKTLCRPGAPADSVPALDADGTDRTRVRSPVPVEYHFTVVYRGGLDAFETVNTLEAVHRLDGYHVPAPQVIRFSFAVVNGLVVVSSPPEDLGRDLPAPEIHVRNLFAWFIGLPFRHTTSALRWLCSQDR